MRVMPVVTDRFRKLCLKAHKRLRLLQSTPPDDDGASNREPLKSS